MDTTTLNSTREILSLPELYEKYAIDIYRYTLSILKNQADAEDAVQETFAKYYENQKTFRGDASQKTWLLVVARNYCFSRLKKASNVVYSMEEECFDIPYEISLDDKITLQEAMSKLTPAQNELIFLKEYGKYSYIEIAELTGDSLENVKIKLFRTRQILRRILKR